jgi:hypothetical protein
MKIITYAVLDMHTMQWVPELEKSYEYNDGTLALCDRALQSAAQNNAKTAGATASGYGTAATDEGAALNPFYTSEMKAQHGFSPTQTNELLTAAEAGGGGAASSLTGQAGLEAARTRNASGFTKSLDEAARDKEKAAAGASEGIASEDVMGAKKLNQEGAAGMEGLYGTNVGAQLKAMGQQDQDINTAVTAGNSGWLQNGMGVLKALQGAGGTTAGGSSFAL